MHSFLPLTLHFPLLTSTLSITATYKCHHIHIPSWQQQGTMSWHAEPWIFHVVWGLEALYFPAGLAEFQRCFVCQGWICRVVFRNRGPHTTSFSSSATDIPLRTGPVTVSSGWPWLSNRSNAASKELMASISSWQSSSIWAPASLFKLWGLQQLLQSTCSHCQITGWWFYRSC